MGWKVSQRKRYQMTRSSSSSSSNNNCSGSIKSCGRQRSTLDDSLDSNETSSSGNTVPKRRRRLRCPDAALEQLATTIVQGKSVVFVTGAGLSVASGIPPFRSGQSWKYKPQQQEKGVWDQVLWTTATRQAFRQDPVAWYNDFWWPCLGRHAGKARPNVGHDALQDILQQFSNCRQITQNIDGLQLPVTNKKSSGQRAPPQQLIEIHGRLGLYKCLPAHDSDSEDDDDDSDSDRPVHLGHRRKTRMVREQLKDSTTCPYQYLDSLTTSQLEPKSARKVLLQYEQQKDTALPRISEAPRCPVCDSVVMPQALLFDEGYHAHSFYQFELAEDWLANCQVLVLMGTSCSVGLTDQALKHAQVAGITVYNFNLVGITGRDHVSNILGPADQTLPRLARVVREMQHQRQEPG